MVGFMVSLDLFSDFAIVQSTPGQEFRGLCSSPRPKTVSPPIK